LLVRLFLEYISEIVVADEVGAPKPNEKIFQEILKRTQTTNDKAIMIGDLIEEDIKGALNANIKAVWYNPDKKQNDTGISPNYEIANLLELKNIL
jgi:FMN phosphatase YigB (HAD superfamily)